MTRIEHSHSMEHAATNPSGINARRPDTRSGRTATRAGISGAGALKATVLLLVMTVSANSVMAEEERLERLTWAGVKITANDTTVLIDPVGSDLWDGKAPEGLVPVEADTRRRYALITHMHNDHFDVSTLSKVLGDRGYVICHEDDATYVASRGLQVIPARMYEPVMRGGFMFTALPAEDGLGDNQVSWVVTTPAGRRIFHAGDTLWHGKLAAIGKQFGPLDYVLLPINGARLAGEPVTETPFTLTPDQAVDAALLLRAGTLIPIHFGLNDPPHYVEVENPLETVLATAKRREVNTHHLLPGETIQLSE